jgi:TP901 family phage tail tape measure protein
MATTMKVPTIFTAVDRFSGVVSRMSRSVSAFGETAQASAMRTSRSLNSFGTSMLTGGVALGVGLGYAINEAGKFEKAMASVSTLTNDTPIQMKAMGDSVLEMSKKVPVAISDLTIGLYDVVSAGIKSEFQLKVLKDSAILAVAGLGTTKEAVNITTSALNAFNISGSKATDVTNMLMKAVKYGKTTVSGLSEGFGANAALIKNSNVSLEEYLATTATLTTTGMTAARAQTQVSSAVTALIKPSKNMQLVLDKLGAKNIPQFIKKNGSLVKTLELVRDKADEMGIMTSKAFGRKEGFSAMLSLLY